MKPPTPSRTFLRVNPPASRALRLAAWAWFAILIVCSLQPLRVRAIAFGKPLHPLLHIFLFGLTAALLLIRSTRGTERLIRASGVLLLAVGLETAQSLLYGHRTEWRDFWSDAFGVLIALVAARVFQRRVKSLSRIG